MPVSLATLRDPFRGTTTPQPLPSPKRGPALVNGLRIPQARVLAALMPFDDRDPLIEWPLLKRTALAAKAGYTAISGSITRALNGIHPGSSSGDPHPGLIARGLVVEVVVDVEGMSETTYRATPAGVVEFRAWQAAGGIIPRVKDIDTCTNDRYKKGR